MKSLMFFCVLFAFATGVPAQTQAEQASPLANAVILIIRHAEKPDNGWDLSPAGHERARAYVNYFKDLTVDAQPLKINYIMAAADSNGSHRPRLTVEPTAKALGLAIDTRFKDKEYQGLADDLRATAHGRVILIAWHHGQIPSLVRALGGAPEQVIPDGKWPAETFGWMIELRYDAQGKVVETRRINEHLMPDDGVKAAEKA